MTERQPPARAAALPWLDPARLALKPENAPDFGYLDAEGAKGCTADELVARIAQPQPPVAAVWTPDSPRLVLPEEVSILQPTILRQSVAGARKKLELALTLFAAAVAYLLYDGAWKDPGDWRFFVAGLVGLWAASRAVRYAEARRLTVERLPEVAAEHRHALWISRQTDTATRWIGWLLIGVYACQYFSGPYRSVLAAGVVKSLVRLGDWWRLVTGPMLHSPVQPLHLILNYGSLLALGKLVEVHAGRPYVPLVFIVSAIGGSVLSTALVPIGASVGASGGIMGLLGFLAVLALRRRPWLPPGFMRTVLLDLAGVAAFGILGYQFIDNAAHLGGFLTGAALGALLVRSSPASDAARSWSLAPGPGVRAAGAAALGATTLAAALAVAALFGRWQ